MIRSVFLTLSLLISVISGFSEGDKVQNNNFGNTLNAGLGIGWGVYGGVPLSAHYEVSAIREDITLGPVIGFGTYSTRQNLSSSLSSTYRSTYLSLGVKGLYYFDDLIGLDDSFDLFAGPTLGFTYWSHRWTNNSNNLSDDNIDSGTSPLWIGLSVGGEYKFNDQIGVFLDFGLSGWSTIGASFKL